MRSAFESYIFNFEKVLTKFSHFREFYCLLFPTFLWVKYFYGLNFTTWVQKLGGCWGKKSFLGFCPSLIFLSSYCWPISREHAHLTVETYILTFPCQYSLAPYKKARKGMKKERQRTLILSEGLSHVSMASFLLGPGHVGQSSLKAPRGWLTSIKEAMFLTKVFLPLLKRSPEGTAASPAIPWETNDFTPCPPVHWLNSSLWKWWNLNLGTGAGRRPRVSSYISELHINCLVFFFFSQVTLKMFEYCNL